MRERHAFMLLRLKKEHTQALIEQALANRITASRLEDPIPAAHTVTVGNVELTYTIEEQPQFGGWFNHVLVKFNGLMNAVAGMAFASAICKAHGPEKLNPTQLTMVTDKDRKIIHYYIPFVVKPDGHREVQAGSKGVFLSRPGQGGDSDGNRVSTGTHDSLPGDLV